MLQKEAMTELITIITDGWVLIGVAAFMVAMFLYGYRKGLVRMSVNIVSIVVSLIATRMLLPTVQTWIDQNPVLRELVAQRVEKIAFGEGAAGAESAAGERVDFFYQLLGLDKLTEYIADRITGMLVSVITFVLLLIVVTLLVKLAFAILARVAELPVLNFMNRILGAILGLVESIVYIWIFLIVISFLPENPLTLNIAMQFNDPTTWLFYLKEANIFVHIFEACAS